MRVLIAEDETIIRLDLRQMLEKQGLTVCAEARNGAEAVELARTTQPDCAVLDVHMPELDGNRGGAADLCQAAIADPDVDRFRGSQKRR